MAVFSRAASETLNQGTCVHERAPPYSYPPTVPANSTIGCARDEIMVAAGEDGWNAGSANASRVDIDKLPGNKKSKASLYRDHLHVYAIWFHPSVRRMSLRSSGAHVTQIEIGQIETTPHGQIQP